MSVFSSIFKGGSQLALGQIVSQACSFVRNLVIARIVSPADFGIAATFAMTLSLMEMVSNVASEMLLVQSPEGNEPGLQSTAQAMKVVRGIGNGLILLALAIPLSRLFGVPQATWAFACLAVYPFLLGFSHLDTYRLQREMKFMPWVLMTAGSNALVTVITFPLVYWLRNYSVMLWVLVLQSLFQTIISHFVAKRRYTWAWDKNYVRSMFHFGWPLLINGLLMYGIFEGDRLIIGSSNRLFPRSHFTLSDLGVYSVAFALTMAPTMVVANIGTSLFLPLLSQAQKSVQEFRERYALTSQLIAIAAILITLPVHALRRLARLAPLRPQVHQRRHFHRLARRDVGTSHLPRRSDRRRHRPRRHAKRDVLQSRALSRSRRHALASPPSAPDFSGFPSAASSAKCSPPPSPSGASPIAINSHPVSAFAPAFRSSSASPWPPPRSFSARRTTAFRSRSPRASSSPASPSPRCSLFTRTCSRNSVHS